MLHKKFLIALIALMSLNMAAFADEETLRYEVQRNGKAIGTHEVEFERKGERLTVEVETDVRVKIAFLTVYRFAHEAEEQWQNSKLTSYHSKTDDNGTDKFLNLSLAGNTYTVDGSAGRFEAADMALPASLWHKATATQEQLMNTLDGHNMAVSIEDAGLQTITAAGKNIEARHFIMSGELQRELWYADERLVRVKFFGEDGSTIEYELQ